MSAVASPKDTYLVIGGSGFLGRHIVQKILAQNDVVSVLDVVQRYHDTPFFAGDMCVVEDVLEAIRRSSATCVIHTASPLPDSADELLHRVNVDGTKAVIRACQQAVQFGLRKLVYTSSFSVVFNGSHLDGVDEKYSIPEIHYQAYNRTKALAEKYILASNKPELGFVTCALRPSTIFGPGDQLALNIIHQTYLSPLQSRFQIGNNTNLFDWTYVENVADAHLLAASKLSSDPLNGVAGQAFFITNDHPIPFWNFIRDVYAGFDKFTGQNVSDQRRIVIPMQLGYFLAILAEIFSWLFGIKSAFSRLAVSQSCATRWHSIDKAKRVLGYSPRISYEDGLKITLEWWAKERGLTISKT